MVNNQTHRVIVIVIDDYEYIYNVICYDCDYIASDNGYYDYVR